MVFGEGERVSQQDSEESPWIGVVEEGGEIEDRKVCDGDGRDQTDCVGGGGGVGKTVCVCVVSVCKNMIESLTRGGDGIV